MVLLRVPQLNLEHLCVPQWGFGLMVDLGVCYHDSNSERHVFSQEIAIKGQWTNFVTNYVLKVILQNLRLMEYECFRFFRSTDYSHRSQCLWFLPYSGLGHLCRHMVGDQMHRGIFGG